MVDDKIDLLKAELEEKLMMLKVRRETERAMRERGGLAAG